MTDQVDNLFKSLDDYYPGSKKKRRAVNPNAKPKKVVSKGMILMGVGFLLLTWGAVNVFKDRRG